MENNETKFRLLGKKIFVSLATYLHQKPKPLSLPQEVEEIKEKEDEVSSDVPINTIVMPIRITFDNPIDFNDHFSKPKDFKKDLAVAFDSTKSSILPPPLLDSDSPFTAELSASITLNSLGNEDKVLEQGILVYHAIHDKNLVTLEENLKENISSETLLFLKEPSSPRPPPEPPDVCMRFKPILAMKNDFVKPNEDFYLSETVLSLNVEDFDSFTFIIWTFLPYFTYPKDSPLIFSFKSKYFVFDPGIVISQWHFQWMSLVLSVALPKDELIQGSSRAYDSVNKNKPLRGSSPHSYLFSIVLIIMIEPTISEDSRVRHRKAWKVLRDCQYGNYKAGGDNGGGGNVLSRVLKRLQGTDISKITRKPSKTGKHGREERKSTKEARDAKPKAGKVKKSKLWSTLGQFSVNKSQP
ncbi:hypothetical protein Tco_1041830 [Tanacetum coccineum]|uniref:Uncharacterized protein n=1 Tax=Tanacetum coccineum TaxID=301880 RepID=A0ABQ5GIM2_9ASTR